MIFRFFLAFRYQGNRIGYSVRNQKLYDFFAPKEQKKKKKNMFLMNNHFPIAQNSDPHALAGPKPLELDRAS